MKKPAKPKINGKALVEFLGYPIPLPLRFASPLPFSPEDINSMPWLDLPGRTYQVESEIGKGGRATAFRGKVLDEHKKPWRNMPDIVIKIPNIEANGPYTILQIRDYLERQNRESGREWQLTRERLRGCQYANPIIDFTTQQVVYHDELLQVPFTAQIYLNDAKPLDAFLLAIGQRHEPYMSQQGKPVDNWNGMNGASNWIKLGRLIAIALADIHQRRVVHGDIWPPNIFIKQNSAGEPLPIFIDFGEAYPLEPKGEQRTQRDHAYRAPERTDAQSIVTQQADVYSFGKLLLHLAMGAEPTLDHNVRGHKRRDDIRKAIKKRNQALVNDNPFIMDIICNCITVDPVDRPSMDEVVRAFDTYVDFEQKRSVLLRKFPDRARSLLTVWKTVSQSLSQKGHAIDPFLEGLLTQKLDELEWMIKSLGNEVVILRDTREKLILSMVSLFLRMGKGDRFLSITSPRMWQGSALGLDGRYFTASKLAIMQGAAIQRLFVVSIQEIGLSWAQKWAANLQNCPDKRAGHLSNMLEPAIRDCSISVQSAAAYQMSSSSVSEAQLRLKLIFKSYGEATEELGTDRLQIRDYETFLKGTGMYLGLLIVGTMQSVKIIKAAHPVSVFYFENEEPHNQYLLLMTDCHGRNTPGVLPPSVPNQIAASEAKPELRGITVFKSVLGIPEERIKSMESLFQTSTNVIPWIDQLVSSLPDVEANP